MVSELSSLIVRLATGKHDLHATQRLRYDVFVDELGGDGELVDHINRFERDEFDAACDHLVLVDPKRDPANLDHVVGAYRLLRGDAMQRIGRFYSEGEYDLMVLKESGRRLLELGRSCLHRDHRGGTAMYLLWHGLADYVAEHDIDILFGVASFHGTDVEALKGPLSFLHHRHLAPSALRVTARGTSAQDMDLVAEKDIDRRAAMVATPALIKAYLRLGGYVGEGAFLDRAFNTTDVCLVMDTAHMNAKHRDMYTKARS